VDRGGPSAIVDDPGTGGLVEPDDRGALEGALVAAIADREGRRERGERARRSAAERYSWSHVGEALDRLVRGSLAGVAAGRG
jgi:glycosyltransferase involved in cell wall biosynthesis